MVEAVKTTGSTAEVWVIVIVAVTALAFWLTAIMLADRSQARASGSAGTAGEVEPGGEWAGGSVPGQRSAEIPGEAAHEPIGRHALPRQRTGEADSAARSYAGPVTPYDEEQGR